VGESAVVVAVTRGVYDKARGVFDAAEADGLRCVRAPSREAELAAAVRDAGAAHAVVGGARYVEALYAALPSGGVLARFGVGHDGIDKARATAAGLLCTNTPGTLEDSVAEHTFALLLAGVRRLAMGRTCLRSGRWKMPVGFELRGKTLAVVGAGAIGCRVAEIASRGFGMRVVGCKARPVDIDAKCRRHGFARITTDLAQAVRDADVVSLHVPATPQTQGLIGAAVLARMRPGAWLVNTGRGSVVDEAALYEALTDGTLGGAALDVFAAEPYVPADPARDLRRLPNVVLTPHVGSSTREACGRMAARALRNITLAAAGRHEEMDLLNPEVTAKSESRNPKHEGNGHTEAPNPE